MPEKNTINIFIPVVCPPNGANAAEIIDEIAKACYNYNSAVPVGNCSGSARQNLDNPIDPDFPPSEGANPMAKKFNQYITINGEKCWISANSAQDFAEKVVARFGSAPASLADKHSFKEYAENWFEIYSKPNIETVTALTYARQLRLHILPALGDMAVEDITTDHIQRLFNSMSCTKETKNKTRVVLNQILNAAVEDGLIRANPLNSRRLKPEGGNSKPTEPYSVEQMRYLVSHIKNVQNPDDRAFLALMALHPFRLEEVLGLRGEDIDKENSLIHIRRAVTHPDRNQPEVKETKTASSARDLPLSSLALPHIPKTPKGKYILGGDAPLTYTQVRRMCGRIKRDTGFGENITPIRFRTTVLTDLYDATKDIKLTQTLAGHTTSAMTMKYYVKGRESSQTAAAALEQVYAS